MGLFHPSIKRLPGGYPRWQLSKPPEHIYMVGEEDAGTLVLEDPLLPLNFAV